MKKSILASLALAGLAFCGCTQDEVLMSEADEANERAQIQALAEEYGLKVEFDEAARLARSTAEPLNMDSVEAEMKTIASLFGEYSCIAHRGDTAIFGKPTPTTAPVKRLTKGFLEGISGSFEEWISGYDGALYLSVTCSATPMGGPPSVSISVIQNLGTLPVDEISITSVKRGGNTISFTATIYFIYGYGRISINISGTYDSSSRTGRIYAE